MLKNMIFSVSLSWRFDQNWFRIAKIWFMALLDYSNKETLLMILRGFKNVYQKSDRYVHGHDPKVPKTGLTLFVSILIASRNATILLVQILHRIIHFCSNVTWTFCNNIVEDYSLIKKFGDISSREDVFGRR